MATPEACEVTLREGAFPKGGWDRVAILGSHEQPTFHRSANCIVVRTHPTI
jgi:predicted RNA binding protein YcfA (HicA-like mRNA interferase family)